MTATTVGASEPNVQPQPAPAQAVSEPNLSISRNLKISLFHLGSGMADVMATGVWNRVMISDLGFSATPIGLLVSLRYFLAPLGMWAGRISDERPILGFHRLFWIWLGRGLMAASIATLGIITGQLVAGAPADAVRWIGIALSLLLFSFGNAISGSTFLALIYDRAAPSQRGRAVGIVWTFLLLGYTVGGIVFGIMLPAHKGDSGLTFTPETVVNLFVGAAIILAGLWFISVLGEERRSAGVRSRQDERNDEGSRSIRSDLKLAFSNRQTRYFFWYLGLSMLFAFSQDLILEPFAGDVFGMSANVTTRFAAYWGTTAIIGTVVFLVLARRYKRLTNTVMSYVGVVALMVAFGMFAFGALANMRQMVTPGLLALGIGLGIWNVGTLGLMMDMSPVGRAGAFLGFWTLVVTIARGVGVSGGGIARDLSLQITGAPDVAYGLVFVAGMVGLGVSLWALSRVDVRTFKSEYQPEATATSAEAVLAASLD
ncbi:MAG: BCD family MFS transporter [Anaerolineae bacterium]